MMATGASTRVGKRGTVVIPAKLRRQFGIDEGSVVIAEARKQGVLIRPAARMSVEMYTPERKAEFLLSNATDAKDYARAVRHVCRMGLEPTKMHQRKPRAFGGPMAG